MKFSVQPLPGDDAFQQWNDAMKAVARLPMGIPPEFRKTVSVFFLSTDSMIPLNSVFEAFNLYLDQSFDCYQILL